MLVIFILLLFLQKYTSTDMNSTNNDYEENYEYDENNTEEEIDYRQIDEYKITTFRPFQLTNKNYYENENENYDYDDKNTEEEEMDYRIVGGKNTKEIIPYIVSLQLVKQHHCGGSLISDKFVLTAAHCLIVTNQNRALRRLNPKSFRVIIGIQDLSRTDLEDKYIQVLETYPHPGYNGVYIFNDIGIVELTVACNGCHIIKLASRTIINRSLRSFKQTTCAIAGWGAYVPMDVDEKLPSEKSYTPFLQYAKIPLIPSSKCANYYPSRLFNRNIQICTYARGVDPCKGDSGGPLVCNGVQYGIVSFGIGCAQNYPGVYTRIDAYQRWITGVSGVSGTCSNYSNYLMVYFIIIFNIFFNL